MRRAVLVLLALLAAPPAWAGGKIVAYGMYATGPKTCPVPTRPILNCRIGNVAHLATVTDIPGTMGVTFGLDYALDTGATPVRTIMIFPPAGLHNPRYPVAHSFTTDEICAGQCFVSYGFDFPWEVVPGIWTFQIWANGQVVVQKQFNVYLPNKKRGKPGKGRLWRAPYPESAR